MDGGGGEIACRGGRRRPGRLRTVDALWIKVFTRRGLGPGILDGGPEVYLGKRGVPVGWRRNHRRDVAGNCYRDA